MSNSAVFGDSGGRRLFDDLRRRLADAKPGRKREEMEAWFSEHDHAGLSDAEIHSAWTAREIFREAQEDLMQAPQKRLVLVLHGIRDQGPWMEMVKERLTTPDVVVQPIDYEFYDAPRFISGWGTRAVQRIVTEKIRDSHADHPGAELIIIAHSFGTFLSAHILLNEPDIRCARLIFCGAVVSKRFPFRRLTQRPQIVNECGDCDIWPVVAQGFSLWNSYGASGVWGIRRPGVEDRFHDFRHSDYLKPDFVDKYWKPYVENGAIVKSPHQADRRDVPWGVSLLSYGWWLVIPGLFFTVIAIGIARWLSSIAWTFSALGIWTVLVPVWILLAYRITKDVLRFHSPIRAVPGK